MTLEPQGGSNIGESSSWEEIKDMELQGKRRQPQGVVVAFPIFMEHGT